MLRVENNNLHHIIHAPNQKPCVNPIANDQPQPSKINYM